MTKNVLPEFQATGKKLCLSIKHSLCNIIIAVFPMQFDYLTTKITETQ